MEQKQVKTTNAKSFGNKTRITTIVLHSLIVTFTVIVASLMTYFLVKFHDTWYGYWNGETKSWANDDIKVAWFLTLPVTVFAWAFVIASSVMFVKVADIISNKDKTKVSKAYTSVRKLYVTYLVFAIVSLILFITACALCKDSKVLEDSNFNFRDEYSSYSYHCGDSIIASTVFTGLNIGVLSAGIHITR